VTTAYHEAGHALVSLYTPGSNELHKVTIIPRGVALGVTHYLPEMDAVSRNYKQYMAHVDTCMGGRAAEEAVYGVEHVSSGISSDLQQATRLAYALVTEYGFSEKLGSLDLHSNYDSLSSQTKQEIESEVRTIVEGARRRADSIMKSKRQELEMLKDALIEFETLSRDEVLQIMKGEKLKRLVPELQETKEEKKDDDEHGRGGPPQPKQKKETGKKGGVGIKLPDVLLPPGTTGSRREGEGT
jgi:ATP-dependent metalloprotease